MKRFAIYFAPPEDSPLTRLAAAWLGRDAFGDSPLPDPPRNGFSREIWRAATSDPRTYGFHATLKPPFRLLPDTRQDQLIEALEAFAAQRKSFTAPPLKMSSLSSFMALTLSAPSPDFEALAADCVREFDALRAPPFEEELSRRKRARLSARQLEYLHEWGYPYVMEEWRFHMTLTSSLETPLFENIGEHLDDLFSAHCGGPLPVDSICLFEQDGEGVPFCAVRRFFFS